MQTVDYWRFGARHSDPDPFEEERLGITTCLFTVIMDFTINDIIGTTDDDYYTIAIATVALRAKTSQEDYS
jgi:hypothetical protein